MTESYRGKSKKKFALMKMEPQCIKDVHRLNGIIVALGQFISKST